MNTNAGVDAVLNRDQTTWTSAGPIMDCFGTVTTDEPNARRILCHRIISLPRTHAGSSQNTHAGDGCADAAKAPYYSANTGLGEMTNTLYSPSPYRPIPVYRRYPIHLPPKPARACEHCPDGETTERAVRVWITIRMRADKARPGSFVCSDKAPELTNN